jgi:hypothetical protein
MTFEEEQDLAILSVFVKDDSSFLYYDEFTRLTEEIVGDGFWSIIEGMVKSGLIHQGDYLDPAQPTHLVMQERTKRGYAITAAGKNKYHALIAQKAKERKDQRILIWTLIAAIVGAIAAIVGIILPLLLKP